MTPLEEAKPITEARVAAAFEAWVDAWLADRDGLVDDPDCEVGEPWDVYAKRLAAGLFKYLERVS